jgi:hypothetical protein
MATLVLAIVLLLDSFSLPRPCKFAIHLFSDNQGLVNRITKMQHWKTLYPSTALIPEWDLLSVILTYINQLRVKAHRNDPKYSPSCPACGDPMETNEHFLLCKAPSRLAWR